MNMNIAIVMVMNIYIQDDVKQLLQDYRKTGKSMSALVNHLIQEYFSVPLEGEFKKRAEERSKNGEYPSMPTARIASPLEPGLHIDASKGTSVTTTIPVSPPKTELSIPVITPTRIDNGVCMIHGTPLDDRGRCLQKGCKYA